MSRQSLAFVASVVVACAQSANAFVFTLTPVTNTTPNFAGPILIQGTVTIAAGETFISPNVMSTVNLPFMAAFTAGFNGNGQTWDAGFLAWNGVGTYTGAIYNHQISVNNLGYSGGMPIGFYGSNPLGPGGLSSLKLWFIDTQGVSQSVNVSYAINVVPAPAAATLLGLGGLLTTSRRRRPASN